MKKVMGKFLVMVCTLYDGKLLGTPRVPQMRTLFPLYDPVVKIRYLDAKSVFGLIVNK